jgi:hypothetical protein
VTVPPSTLHPRVLSPRHTVEAPYPTTTARATPTATPPPSSPSATAGAPWVSRKTKREETLRASQRLAPQVSIIASCSTPRRGCASVSFGREAEVLLARRTRRPTRAQWPLGSACAVDPRHHHPRPAVRDLVLAGPDGDAGAAAGTATTGSTTAALRARIGSFPSSYGSTSATSSRSRQQLTAASSSEQSSRSGQ